MRINTEDGFIEWENGTGGNHEITQIKAYTKGNGRRLIEKYLAEATPPFYSVYAFVLASRAGSREFYKAMGFFEVDMGQSVYRDDRTILVWRPFYEDTHSHNPSDRYNVH